MTMLSVHESLMANKVLVDKSMNLQWLCSLWINAQDCGSDLQCKCLTFIDFNRS